MDKYYEFIWTFLYVWLLSNIMHCTFRFANKPTKKNQKIQNNKYPKIATNTRDLL